MAGLAVALVATAARAELQSFQRDELTIEGEAGSHRFTVEVAVTPQQRGQGLMFRERLPAEAGMLFVYPAEQMISMWMKNTLIPLDMLFIAEDGRIIHIAERAIPGSTATISSGQPARAVLELNGGTAARLNIVPGDRVLYEIFGTADRHDRPSRSPPVRSAGPARCARSAASSRRRPTGSSCRWAC